MTDIVTANNAGSLFEQASILKVRFDSPKGQLLVEELWDIPLTSKTGKANLNTISMDLFAQIKAAETKTEGSIMADAPKVDETLQLKYDLVQYIGKVRIAAAKTKAEADERAEKKRKLQELIERKKDEKLEGASLEELEALAASL